jgi:hypothetical protein
LELCLGMFDFRKHQINVFLVFFDGFDMKMSKLKK